MGLGSQLHTSQYSKIMNFSMRSKDLEIRVKKSNDLYFKTEGVHHKIQNCEFKYQHMILTIPTPVNGIH